MQGGEEDLRESKWGPSIKAAGIGRIVTKETQARPHGAEALSGPVGQVDGSGAGFES